MHSIGSSTSPVSSRTPGPEIPLAQPGRCLHGAHSSWHASASLAPLADAGMSGSWVIRAYTARCLLPPCLPGGRARSLLMHPLPRLRPVNAAADDTVVYPIAATCPVCAAAALPTTARGDGRVALLREPQPTRRQPLPADQLGRSGPHLAPMLVQALPLRPPRALPPAPKNHNAMQAAIDDSSSFFRHNISSSSPPCVGPTELHCCDTRPSTRHSW